MPGSPAAHVPHQSADPYRFFMLARQVSDYTGATALPGSLPTAAAQSEPAATTSYSETFFTNCDLSPIWPMPGILQSIS